MNENLKFIIFNNIYNILGLKDIENQIIKIGIKPKNIENPAGVSLISKYFFLLNDVKLENLTENELEYLNHCYTNYQNGDSSELYTFLNKNIQKLLFTQNQNKYINYGNSFMQTAPSDSIAIAFHYNNFECNDEQENFICDMLNYIQYNLAKKINVKVAVLKYGIYINNQNFVI